MPRAAVAESRIVALVVAGRESVVRNVDIVSGRDCGEGVEERWVVRESGEKGMLSSLRMVVSAAVADCFFSSRVGSLGLDCAWRCTESLARWGEVVEM